jgi:hypothetical protein
MKLTIRKLLIIFSTSIFYLVCISSCAPRQLAMFKCIPPIVTLSFPIDQYKIQASTSSEHPFEKDWAFQLQDPKFGDGSQIIARKSDQIWVLQNYLLMYQPSNKKTTDFSLYWEGNSSIPFKLFLAKKGDLWGIGSKEKGTKPFLYKFNDISNQFQPIMDKDNLLFFEGPISGGVAEDSVGRIWITIQDKGLYVFDPETNIAELKQSSVFLNTKISDEIAVDSQDGIWVERIWLPDYSHVMSYFNQKENKTTILSMPPDPSDPSNIFIDSESRLWVSDYAFWKIGSSFPSEGYTGWNMIIRSPVFISDQHPLVTHRWFRPKILFEDSHGDIWFSSYGLIRLNTKTGEWCRVISASTYEMDLTEDLNGVYWTIFEGKLYKHN